ncbi:hypothetical protein ACFVS7_06990 [Streptomyces rubiginosohelvolus]|uniref:hypothetical protein n=1 Tax=Streptomyces rubiginosohelvolus TaxID=67362 RepID=UPI0036DBEEE0
MTMYAPHERVILLLCFNEKHEVALVPEHQGVHDARWTLPRLRVGDHFAQLAGLDRPLADSGLPTFRWGAVEGRVVSGGDLPGRGHGAAETRIVCAHAVGSAARSLAPPPSIRWVPYLRAPRMLAHLDVPDLGLFMRGYVEGWIPDGVITLEAPLHG